jgi:hypothetical protein
MHSGMVALLADPAAQPRAARSSFGLRAALAIWVAAVGWFQILDGFRLRSLLQ